MAGPPAHSAAEPFQAAGARTARGISMPSSVISQAVPYFDTDASKEDFGFTVLTERMEHVQYLRNWPFASLDAFIDMYREARPLFITRVRMRVVRAYI